MSPSPIRARAEEIAARHYDPARYPELYAAEVRVQIGFIGNREGNAAAEAALNATGGDKQAAQSLMLAEVDRAWARARPSFFEAACEIVGAAGQVRAA